MIRHTRHFPFFSTRCLRGALITAVTFPVAGWAQTAAPETPSVSGSAILQMLFGLALIIGFLFAGAYLLRKLNGGRSFGQTGPMRIVGGLMLSARERIVLLEVGDEWIVIGIVPGQIKTLHTLPKGEIQAADGSGKSFTQWLTQIGERKKDEL
ncbi:MAG: flagellar biosynthetic protein FliO [Propionivibrio sp.]